MKNNKIQPLVSICIPVYNHEVYVIESIESVIQQTYKNIELIIIDDGSLDDSKKKIETLVEYCQKRFVRFEFRSRPNKGLSSTLNEALSWCSGDYFSALASDDIMLPEKTSKQVEIFLDKKYKDKNIAIVSYEVQAITESGYKMKVEKPVFPNESIFDFDAIYYGKYRIMAPAVMILMDAIRDVGGYKDGLPVEDLYMWLAITKKGYKALYNNEVFTYYRAHDDNTVTKAKLMHQARYDICKIFASTRLELEKAMAPRAIVAFQSAVSSDKRFALELILNRQVKACSFSLIFYTVRIFIPKCVFKKAKALFKK